jgi:hypothetical protein
MDNTVAKPIVSVDEILSPWHREILSGHAVKMYEAVWHRMRIKGQTQIWADDEEISRRSRTLIGFIPGARCELINAGLLECREGFRQWSYKYIEQSDDTHD